MADGDTRMVLRTVYLPPELDDQLRVHAFRSKQTKNDVIREAVALWFSTRTADGVPAAVKPKSRAPRRPKSNRQDAPRTKAAATEA